MVEAVAHRAAVGRRPAIELMIVIGFQPAIAGPMRRRGDAAGRIVDHRFLIIVDAVDREDDAQAGAGLAKIGNAVTLLEDSVVGQCPCRASATILR